MKTTRKHYRLLFLGILTMIGASCSDLDYTNTQVISPENVWKDKTMISAYLNDIHGGMMPGWPYNGNDSDEGFFQSGNLGDFQRGIIDVERTGQGLGYTYIDKINFFLDKISSVTSDVLTDAEKDQMIGQALFWRAWDYFGKVSVLGGVPLILTPQDVTNKELLFVSRNKTSECITQIIKDLDEAIAKLPATWSGSDYGRIDKCAATAFKGKVLMWYASPLFNPNNDPARWDAAYTANKEATDFLKSQGKGLYPDFSNIWYEEQNEEVIMVNQFYYPDHAFFQGPIRPLPITMDDADHNQPYLPLLLAFPKKSGSSISFDADQLTDPTYNASLLNDLYADRDNRFYTTIFMPGTVYPTPDLTGGQRFWTAWKNVAGSSGSGADYFNLALTQTGRAFSGIGYYQLKGLDQSLTYQFVKNAETDWIEIRFAEVLMNYGECANETGKSDEALEVLYQIRKRAGIDPGTDEKYGITATSKSEIREAYIRERQVEFAFENKRFNDLRRWKRYDILNTMKYRSTLYVVLNDGIDASTFNWTDDMSDPSVRAKFHLEYIPNIDKQDQYYFNLDLNHWFYPIAKNDLDRNSKLEQNNEWGGTFDPLQ
jgi:hypothetical protein